MIKSLISIVAVTVVTAVALSVAAKTASTPTAQSWAVVNYRGVDIWLVTPDGVAHAIPPGARNQAAVWRQGDSGVQPPIGAYKWEVIHLPKNDNDLLRKKEVVIENRNYYCRHFTTR